MCLGEVTHRTVAVDLGDPLAGGDQDDGLLVAAFYQQTADFGVEIWLRYVFVENSLFLLHGKDLVI